ncbi:MAG TPA: hypothetical protein VF859_09550 [Burkholderiales bacterium]
MARNLKEPEPNRLIGPAGLSRGAGGLLVAFSFLRWPVTALLVAPGFGFADYRWILIPAVQGGAEAMFWIGVWLVGLGPLRAALARTAGMWRVGASFPRSIRVTRPAS